MRQRCKLCPCFLTDAEVSEGPLLCALCRYDEQRKAEEAEEEAKNPSCKHEGAVVEFDEQAAKGLDEYEVRKRWPRFYGKCPDCGTQLIKYASYMHYIMGDW